eukprot:scaffold39972_cov168-Amphora_coffeaeformis.AAC.1
MSEDTAVTVVIESPEPNDVLCGQDATYGQHPGNTLLRKQLDRALEAYQQATDRRDKIVLIDSIIKYMRETNQSRFLRQSDDASSRGAWTSVSEQSVRDKVSHALRFASRRQRKATYAPQHKKPRTLKKPTLTKPKGRNSSNNKNGSSSTSQPQDELDDTARAYVQKIHHCQQRILERMMSEDETEDDTTSTVPASSQMPVDPERSSHNTATEWQLETQLQQELETIEPIPFHTNPIPKIPPSVEVTQPILTETSTIRTVSLDEMELCATVNKTNMKRSEAVAIDASFKSQPAFELRSEDHYDHIPATEVHQPPPPPMAYYPHSPPGYEHGGAAVYSSPPPSPYAYQHHFYQNNHQYATAPPSVTSFPYSPSWTTSAINTAPYQPSSPPSLFP